MLPCGASRATLHCLALAGACVVASCGGGAFAPAPAVPVQAVASAPLPPPPDLRPAPDPSGLVVSGRLGRLAGLLATVHGWSSLPMPQSEQVTELLIGQAAGPLVDLDQPIDFAVASTGEGTHVRPLAAVSAGVKDVDAAKAALSQHYKLAPAENGALLIQGPGGAGQEDADGDGDEGDHRACELAPAYGAASTRLVCGLDAKALSELGPWLTRTATRATSASDLHVDVRVQPVKPAVSGLKRMFSVVAGGVLDVPAGMRGARDAAMSVGSDLVDFVLDVDTLSLDVQLSDAGVGMTTTTRFSASSSAFTRMVTAHADGGSPTPAAFWQLPGDTDSAAYYRGMDANDLVRVRDLALKLLDAKLADDGVKDADRKLLADALAKLPSVAPAVYASGVDLDAVKRARGVVAALGSAPEASQEAEAKRGLAEALLGWHLVELDEPSSRLAGALKEISAVWSRPGLVGTYRAKDKTGSAPAIRAAPVPRGASLPKDTQHYVIDLPLAYGAPPAAQNPRAPKPGAAKAGAKGRPKPLFVHALLTGDGPRTWLAIGGDEALLAAKLGGAMVGGPANARPDLAFFKDARTGAAGFFTLRAGAVMTQQLAVLFSALGMGADDSLEDVAHVPHKGETPIVYSLTAQAGGPPTSVVATLQLPREAIEDVVVGVLRHGGF